MLILLFKHLYYKPSEPSVISAAEFGRRGKKIGVCNH